MKLAGITSVANPVKGTFGPEDGNQILLDFTQGSHGRAFCGAYCYDLPDPRSQLVNISAPTATLEVTSAHSTPASLGVVEVESLKVTGDVRAQVLRANHLTLNHSSVEANVVTGLANSDLEAADPQNIKAINLRDSRLKANESDLSFLNIIADDDSVSYVSAQYLEGFTTQGNLILQADHLMIGHLEAQEVQVAKPDGCRVGQVFCDRVVQRQGLGQGMKRIQPTYDQELALAMQSVHTMEDHGGPSVDLEVPKGIGVEM